MDFPWGIEDKSVHFKEKQQSTLFQVSSILQSSLELKPDSLKSVLNLPPICCVTLVKLISLFEALLIYLWNEKKWVSLQVYEY